MSLSCSIIPTMMLTSRSKVVRVWLLFKAFPMNFASTLILSSCNVSQYCITTIENMILTLRCKVVRVWSLSARRAQVSSRCWLIGLQLASASTCESSVCIYGPRFPAFRLLLVWLCFARLIKKMKPTLLYLVYTRHGLREGRAT